MREESATIILNAFGEYIRTHVRTKRYAGYATTARGIMIEICNCSNSECFHFQAHLPHWLYTEINGVPRLHVLHATSLCCPTNLCHLNLFLPQKTFSQSIGILPIHHYFTPNSIFVKLF